MKALYRAAIFYLAFGLIAGVFYREFTRANNFPEGEFTQLGVTHTHLLALGFMMFLIFLALEKVFTFSRSCFEGRNHQLSCTTATWPGSTRLNVVRS